MAPKLKPPPKEPPAPAPPPVVLEPSPPTVTIHDDSDDERGPPTPLPEDPMFGRIDVDESGDVLAPPPQDEDTIVSPREDSDAMGDATASSTAASAPEPAQHSPLVPDGKTPVRPPSTRDSSREDGGDVRGILLLLQQQAQQRAEADLKQQAAMAAMAASIRAQKDDLRQTQAAHAAEALARSIYSADVAARGRELAVGSYNVAAQQQLTSMPPPNAEPSVAPAFGTYPSGHGAFRSQAAEPAKVSRSSQADTLPPPPLRAPAVRDQHVERRAGPAIQELPAPKKPRPTTPPLPTALLPDPAPKSSPKPAPIKPTATLQSVTGRSSASSGAAAKPTTPVKHQLPPLPMLPGLPPMPAHEPSDAEQLREIVAKGWPPIQAREALDAVKDSPADTRYLVEDAIRYAMNEWPAGPLDFLLRQNREQNARATAAAAIRPETAAPAPVATAVEDLLARHEAAGKLLRSCQALHDCDRGQHSSDLLIAVSNIKLAAKRSNKQNSDSPYLDAVAAAIASDCQQCHLLIARKAATQAELAETASAKLKAMQQVVLEYPASAGEFVRAPPEADVTCDKCGLGWSAELPFVRLCEGCPSKYHDPCNHFVRVSSLVPTATYNDPRNWICEDCQARHLDRQQIADMVARNHPPPRGGGGGPAPERRDPPPPPRGSGPAPGRSSDSSGHYHRPAPDSHGQGHNPPSRTFVNHNDGRNYRVNSQHYGSFEEQDFGSEVPEHEKEA